MSTPSLLLVPARLKDGTLFSQIPTNGSGDFTVVQAVGNATRVNSSGFVESAKTNLLQRSEGFNDGYWSKARCTVSANQTTAPDGTLTADKLIMNNGISPTAADTDGIYRSEAITSGAYRFSIFAKAAEFTGFKVRENAANGNFMDVNLTNGAITNPDFNQFISPLAQNYGNGWYRISWTSPTTITNLNKYSIRVGSTGNGTSGIFIWGAQVEIGPSVSDYIPTTTVARTKFSGVTVNGTSIANIPRLDYYTSSGTPGCPGLLVEASGQNLAWHSETWASGNNWDLTNGVTTATGSTSAFTAPNGTTTANAISPTSGNVFHYAGSNSTTQITYTSGTIYTQSAFFKAGTGTAGQFVQLTSWFNVATQNAYANYDLQNGLVTVVSGSAADANRSARIDNYGNGWYRCILTFTANANGTERGVRPVLITASGSTRIPAFAGTVTDVLYGWGAQVETGSVATSYIPTTTGSVNRNADVISVSGNVSGSIGQTEGSIYAEVNIQKLLGATQRAIVDIGQSGNRLFLGYGNGLTNQIRFLLQTSTGGLVDFQSATTATGTIRIAVGYKNSDSAMYVNGVKIAPIANGSFTSTLTSLSNVYLGSSLSGADFLNDRINAVALYATRLSDDALMLLSMQGNDAYLPQAIWNFYEDSRTGNTEVPTCLYERHADIIDV